MALCSTILPFVFGGARFMVEWLEECGCANMATQVERIYLPFDEDPETMLTTDDGVPTDRSHRVRRSV